MTIRDSETTHTWSLLAAHLEAFLERWEADSQPPSIIAHLPASPAELRQMALIEMVKADIEYRREKAAPVKALEEYAAEFPEMGDGEGVPVDLIYEEYHLRKQAGEVVAPETYFRRFPSRADQLRRLLGIDSPEATESLGSVTPKVEIGPNDQIEDFELITLLGKGSFASVYLAKQISMQRLVALKVSADRGSEHQTLAQLDHPNIVRVYDVRTLRDKGWRLLYMQHIGGGTLEDVVKRSRDVPADQRTGKLVLESIDAALERAGQSPPTGALLRKRLTESTWPQAVCRIGVQLARALHYAHHKRGVLHRDVKPANVLMAGDAAPKLADFNISFSEQLDGSAPAAYFGGSLAYMSPEQLEACHPRHPTKPADLDGRSDLYSLAVMLWEMLHGKRPFPNVKSGWTSMLVQLSSARRNSEIETPTTSDPLVAQMRIALLKCLEPEVEDRFPDGESFARELELCLQPAAAKLMEVRPTGWRSWAMRFPLIAAIGIAATVPNLVASVFNTLYNWQAIILTLPTDLYPGAEAVFWRLQITINSIFFPIGISLYVVYCWPVFRALYQVCCRRAAEESHTLSRTVNPEVVMDAPTQRVPIRNPQIAAMEETEAVAGDANGAGEETLSMSVELEPTPEPVAPPTPGETTNAKAPKIDTGSLSVDTVRRRALYIGDIGAIICVTAWIIAGITFPVVMNIFVGRFPAIQYVHFFVSLALCGMISGVYPFLLVTFVSLRCFYPTLLRLDLETSQRDAEALRDLERRTSLYLLAAGIVPAVGVMATVAEKAIGFSTDHLAGAAEASAAHTAALVFLSCLGAFGFAAAYFIAGAIQRDAAALRQFVTPADET